MAAVWLIVTLAFVVVYALPGDPARLVLGQHASAETVERFRSAKGLDKPLVEQYIIFLERASRFDFGDSLTQRRPVRKLIGERSKSSVMLLVTAVGLVGIFAFVLPIIAAITEMGGERQKMSQVWGILAAIPPYVLAVLLLVIFGSSLKWIPVLFNPDRAVSWVVAAFTLATYPVSIVIKLFQQELAVAPTRSYAVRAKAFGFSWRYILVREVLPNIVTPSLVALANSVAFFVTGTFFVEVVFGINGLGSLTYDAISNKDLPLLLGLCVVFGVSVTLITTLLEIIIKLIDPRIRRRHV